MKKNYTDEISAISLEIEKRGDVWELYYQRGYMYFLSDEDDKAKDDYKHALALGLDPTEAPYYSFSASNSKRREFLLPEKNNGIFASSGYSCSTCYSNNKLCYKNQRKPLIFIDYSLTRSERRILAPPK